MNLQRKKTPNYVKIGFPFSDILYASFDVAQRVFLLIIIHFFVSSIRWLFRWLGLFFSSSFSTFNFVFGKIIMNILRHFVRVFSFQFSAWCVDCYCYVALHDDRLCTQIQKLRYGKQQSNSHNTSSEAEAKKKKLFAKNIVQVGGMEQ